MKSLQAVFFDLDGTLIEFHHDYLLEQTKRILGLLDRTAVPEHRLERLFSEFNYFGFIDEEERQNFEAEFWSHFDWDSFPAAMPFSGTHEVLRRVRETGTRISIVTSRDVSPEHLKKDLAHTGLLELVDNVATRNKLEGHWSDKTELIGQTCRDLGLSPSEVAFVGDVPADIESAKAAGLARSVALLSGGIGAHVLRHEEPDLIAGGIGILHDYFK